MEYLATVRDGGEHDFGPGYLPLHIIVCDVDSDAMVPLYQRLWSADAPGFTSEDDEILCGA